MKHPNFIPIALLVSFVVLFFLEVNADKGGLLTIDLNGGLIKGGLLNGGLKGGHNDGPKNRFNGGSKGGYHGGPEGGYHGGPEGGPRGNGEGYGRDGVIRMNFYGRSCPQVENVVRDITWKSVEANPSMPALLLRLHYHDCFVRGCDASILLDSGEGKKAEKDARPNLSLGGYDVIDNIKSVLENQCPQTVSCADIVALAARDAVSYQFRKPMWNVFTGRRDGVISIDSDALRDLPSAGANFTTLRDQFASNGLDVTDLVALSGAHTIGQAHCAVFARRLFNFTGNGDTDPSMNPEYANYLKTKCGASPAPSAAVEMDPNSSEKFDSGYFIALKQRKGLFVSDRTLMTDRQSATIATIFQNPYAFSAQFGRSMIKMGAIQVVTGRDGEIRKNCHVVNA